MHNNSASAQTPLKPRYNDQTANAVDDAIADIQRILNKKGHKISTGFPSLDSWTGGLDTRGVMVLAAHSSMEATTLTLNMVEAAVFSPEHEPVPTLYFSLKMDAEQLTLRLLCSMARISRFKLMDGILPKSGYEGLVKAAKMIKASSLFIDDDSRLTIRDIRKRIHSLIHPENIGLVVVDCLQLMGSAESRKQVAEISWELRTMAKELGILVIILVQLEYTSEWERRQPHMGDFRKNEPITHGAGVVLLLADSHDRKQKGHSADYEGFRDLIIIKPQDGIEGKIKLKLIKSIPRFEEIDYA